MKTLEAFNKIIENPKARIKVVSNNGYRYRVAKCCPETKAIVWENAPVIASVIELCGIIVDAEWELIQEPVDFMTAINSGREIRSASLSDFKSVDYWLRKAMLDLDMINGKWYIKP